jgi:polysaccharide biosynthesis transport protein
VSVSRSLVPTGGSTDLSASYYRPSMVPIEFEPPRPPSRTWAALARNAPLVLALTITGIVLGLLLAWLSPRTYRADAQFAFEQAPVTAGGDAARSGRGLPDGFVSAQLNILRSRSLAEKVVEKLHLDGNAAVARALAVANPQRPDKSALARQLQRAVSATPTSDAGTAKVSLTTREPAASAMLANAYVATFAEDSLQRQYDQTVGARRFLNQQLASVKAKLDTSEKALIDYTRSAGLIDATAGTASVTGDAAPHSLASDDLAQLNQAYAQARADRISAEQRWRAAQQTSAMSLPEVLGNPAIQQLTQKSAEAQAAYQEQRQHRLDNHPQVMAAAAQIGEINKQVDTLASSIKSSIRDQYEVARRNEANLAGTVRRLQGQTLADQGKGATYNRLKREADGNRSLYNTLLQRANDADTAAGLVSSNVAVIDPAVPPEEPYSPKPLIWAASGGGAGLLLGFVSILLIGLRDDRVYSPEGVDTMIGGRVLGVLPRVADPATALQDPRSALAEAHYALRGPIENALGSGASRTLMFTSSREGEGKTTAAVGVARDLAQSGCSTLLIDADMRKPGVQRYFDLPTTRGLSTVLAGTSTAEAAICPTAVPGLSVMLAGPMPDSPAALLSSKRFKDLLRVLSKQYRVIIIDGPPVYGLADAPRIAAAVHRCIFVVEAGRAKVPDIRGAIRRLIEGNARLAGVVLTKFDISRSTSPSNLYVYEYGDRPTKRIGMVEAERA